MDATDNVSIVLVTAPDLAVARKVARALLTNHLAACVNVVPAIESHYWWQGKLESGQETLLIIKTVRDHLEAVEDAVRAHHPYDTPEIVAFPLQSGNRKYLDWLVRSVEKRGGV